MKICVLIYSKHFLFNIYFHVVLIYCLRNLVDDAINIYLQGNILEGSDHGSI